MRLADIFDKNDQWVTAKTQQDRNYFQRLSKGQSPRILYVGCSDSRVTAEDMMGAQPGELFVHRNIANLVPGSDINAISVVKYAVEHLRVSDVVVCGHYHCGGIAAAMQTDNLGILNPWISHIRDVYRLHQETLDAIQDEQARYDRLVELNVQEQCINVFKIPEVQAASDDRRVCVHGWVFDIASGRIKDLKLDLHELLEDVRAIYEVDQA